MERKELSSLLSQAEALGMEDISLEEAGKALGKTKTIKVLRNPKNPKFFNAIVCMEEAPSVF